MKMKAFSILLTLVCIGFVLMLAGNASAQQAQIEFTAETDDIVTEVVERKYEIGDKTRLTITLRRDGAVAPDQPVVFRVLGIVDRNNKVINPDATVASVSPPSGSTNNSGQIETVITFHKGGRIGIEADATAFLGALSVHAFVVEKAEPPPQPPPPPPEITRIVATPKVEGPLAVGDTFTYSIEIKYVKDLAGWQMDLAYNPAVLEAVAVREGDFLASGGVNAAFQSGTLSGGKITGIWQARVGRTVDATGANVLTDPVEGVTGSGELLSIEFQVKQFAEDALGLSNVHLSNTAHISDGGSAGIPALIFSEDSNKPHKRISYHIISNPVVVTHRYPREDVNRDGIVDVLDLVTVAGQLGEAATNPRADVNNDGFVNVMDVILIARHPNWGESVNPIKVRDANNQVGGAPLSVSVGQSADLAPATIQAWIDLAQVEDDGSAIFDLGIAKLERLLQATVPEETKLLLNYPNPFNPETWIPYQLAKATEVTVSIYSVNGTLVRTLALGHQAAGVYQSKSQAAYWDGRNELGERIASGVYFYTLIAGDFSATGKMLVRK